MKKLLKKFRRWRYNKLIRQLAGRHKYMCTHLRYSFPFLSIKYYPELWDRRMETDWAKEFNEVPLESSLWFVGPDHVERRVKFIERAIELTYE